MSLLKKLTNLYNPKVGGMLRTHRDVLKKNTELKNSSTSKICFVIGNGPSLKRHDLTKLTGCKIVMNSFYLHSNIKNINPDYYIFADPEGEDIYKQNVLKWWSDIALSTQGLDTKFILPVSLKGTVVSNSYLSDRKLYYVLFGDIFNKQTASKFDLSKQIPNVQNTLSEGLLLAMYMGYKKIIILGTDHDWLSHWNLDSHFYSGSASAAIGEDIKMPYHWWLNAVNKMFQQYLVINEIAKDNNIEIINCSESGVLDVFPMKMLSEVIE